MATLELPYEKVYDLLHKCCTSISPDVLYLMKRAAAKETNPEAKTFLETMLSSPVKWTNPFASLPVSLLFGFAGVRRCSLTSRT